MKQFEVVKSYSESGFSIDRYFAVKTNKLASSRSYRQVDPDKLLNELQLRYPVDPSNVQIDLRYSIKLKQYKMVVFIYQVTEEIFVYQEDLTDGTAPVSIQFAPNVDMSIMEELSELVISCINTEQKASSNIHLLCYEHGCLILKPFKLKIPEIDLNYNYNDDFLPIHDLILSKLNAPEDKGLVLLHGEPGTGKTTYVRYLSSLVNKKLIYVPPDLAPKIASPDFLPLLMDYPNSILVIEDAENILRERQAGSNGSISNLLNLSDGLLSDCLNIQLLCSFNADLSKIDTALLRKGRIIAKYEFGALKKEKAQKLADNLGQERTLTNNETLAEIYNYQNQSFSDRKVSFIGFK
jgi:hypothetical protein